MNRSELYEQALHDRAGNVAASGIFFCFNLFSLQLKRGFPHLSSRSGSHVRLSFLAGTLNRASKLKSPISVRCNIRVIANTRCAHNCPLLDLPPPPLFLYSPRMCILGSCWLSQSLAHAVDVTRGAMQRRVHAG